jgi:hypothetical protein
VSVDLAIWEGPLPSDAAAARATFEELSNQFLDSPSTPPTEKIAHYVDVLLSRYPDMPDAGEDEDVDPDEVPWGSGPLIGNAMGPILYLNLTLNKAFDEAWRYCVETAAAHGLVSFDPQSDSLANPDPRAPASEWVPTGPRGGPVYRWIALRSWRWWFLRPILRPLLPVLRRFL